MASNNTIPTGPRAMTQAINNMNKYRIPRSSGPGTPPEEPAPIKTSVNLTQATPPGLCIYIPDYSPTPSQTKRPVTPEEEPEVIYENLSKPIPISEQVKIVTKPLKKIKKKAVVNLVTPGPEDNSNNKKKIKALEDDEKKYETVYMFVHHHPSAKSLTSSNFPTLNSPHLPKTINANVFDRPFKKTELNSFKGPDKEEDPAPTFPASTVENTLLLIQDQTIKFLASHTLASPDQVKERNVFIEDINTIIRIGLAGRNPKINYDE